MDLIYMTADKEDIGVLQEYELDLEIGGENDFECTLAAKAHCCHEGYFLYIEGTEYGGVIDSIQSDTGTKDVTYSGRTWHGILGSKIIIPLQGTDASKSGVTLKTTDSKGASLINRYLIVSGDANDCIQYIIDRIGLSDMFAAPGTASGFTINQFQFNRYTDAYKGLQKMLASAGLKLHLEYRDGKVIVSAQDRYDYAEDDSFDSDMLDFRVAKNYKTVNHLICLGSGELEKRMVIHLYADTEGNISQTQTQFGFDEYCAVYDFSAVESEEELLQYGTDELQSMWKQDELSIDFDEAMDAYDVGDIVGAADVVTGVEISSIITKKIVTIKNGKISIDLSTDNVSATGSGATGDGEGKPEGVTSVNGMTGDVTIEATANPLDAYPVGSIYMSVNSTSPASLFGGSWTQLKDRFLLGAGSSYTNGKTGGEANVTLTVDQIPSHSHTLQMLYTAASGSVAWVADNVEGKWDWIDGRIGNTGGGKSHNNLPPYLVVYMWKRVS